MNGKAAGRVRWRAAAVALALGCGLPGAADACTPSTTAITADLGSYSPAAVNAGAVQPLPARAGLSCQPSTLVLLGNNRIKATFRSTNGLKLKGSGGEFAYVASADPAGQVVFAQNGTVDYMQNNLLNLLGLLGGSSADLPFFVQPKRGTAPAAGTYSDTVEISWEWYLCSGLGILGGCLGTPVEGRAKTVVTVTLDVRARPLEITATAVTSWDPVNGTASPKALPGSRRRWTVSVHNPDIVPLDANSVAVTLTLPQRETLALDGDGTGSTAVFALAEGTPASGLTLGYAGPASTADNVDFQTGGTGWTAAPTVATQGSVTAVRLRPQGTMAAGSRFTVTLPALLK
jgi:hypothetical protein